MNKLTRVQNCTETDVCTTSEPGSDECLTERAWATSHNDATTVSVALAQETEQVWVTEGPFVGFLALNMWSAWRNRTCSMYGGGKVVFSSACTVCMLGKFTCSYNYRLTKWTPFQASIFETTDCSTISLHRLLITCALMSLPMSSRSLTVDVWPFMAASISGEIPNLLPVLRKTVQQHIKVTNNHFLLPVIW